MNFWKTLKYWQKGGIIGAFLGFTLYFFSYGFPTSYGGLMDNLIEIIFSIAIDPVCIPFGFSDDCFFLLFFVGWLLLPLIYAMVGAVLGGIIQKLKNQKKVKSKHK